MRMYDLILKKKRGIELTKEEISDMIRDYTSGEIPDYQMSAFLMAVCFKGLTSAETFALTEAMMNSGEKLDLSFLNKKTVDKHSTGGVGDKVTLVLAPMIAALGIPVAKMSGRGLGHTGGTIDKLESIPGFQTSLSNEEFKHQLKEIGIVVAGQTSCLAPADKMLYSLRDATATVDQLSLIASSIMSKKLASGSDGIVLDVKVGDGAFMKEQEAAKELAELMVAIGTQGKKDTIAVLTSMEQPLGYAVGNQLELEEALKALSGEGPEDLMEVVFCLGAQMLLLAGIVSSEEEGKKALEATISNGIAKNKFIEFVQSQKGDISYLTGEIEFPKANYIQKVIATENGYISKIRAESIGHAAMLLGGGREKKEDIIDPLVGIVLNKKIGDQVCKGDVLATIYANQENTSNIQDIVSGAYQYSSEQVKKPDMILEIIKNSSH